MIPDRILVPTDGSKPAMAAEQMAAELATAIGSIVEVEVLHVIHLSSIPEGFISENLVRIKEMNYLACTAQERQGAEALIDAAVKRIEASLGSGATVTGRVLEAPSVAAAIIEEAHAKGACSLVIMGNRGLGGFGSLVMGSVSSQVLHGAHCPVLIVKAD